MRMTILALGTHGDIQPFVALGIGLQRAGHSVRFAAQDNHREFVAVHGLEFASLGEAPADVRKLQAKLLDAARFLESFLPGRSAPSWPGRLPWLDRLMEDSWKACEGADAVISGILLFWVNAFAEKLNVPWYLGFLQPCTPTRLFPSLFFTAATPSWMKLGGGFNLLTHRVAERIAYEISLRLANPGRHEMLGLPLLPNTKAISRFYNERAVILYAYSAVLSPKPPDWPPWHHVTGFWFLDHSSNWKPQADLVDFLASGPPPVYVGFGSFSDRDPKRLTGIVMEALARTGQRGIVLTGWGGLTREDLPDTIFPIASVPHDWLFPRVAAVVHHGGAGTTGAALRAGVPSVAIPWRGDHPFFANCAYEIGASPRPIPKKRLSASRLASAIEEAVHAPRIRQCAADAAQQIAKEDGVARAVETIERDLQRGHG